MNRILIVMSFFLVACAEPEPQEEGAPEGSTSSAEGASSEPIDDPPRADLGVEPPSSCSVACSQSEACVGVTSTDCLLRCVAELEAAFETSEACGDAQAALEGCVGTLSCADRQAHAAGQDNPCQPEASAVSLACSAPGGEPPAPCLAFCSAAEACDLSAEDECLAACAEARAAAAESGSACADAQDQRFSCAAELDCVALTDWMTGEDTSSCPADFDRACSGDQE